MMQSELDFGGCEAAFGLSTDWPLRLERMRGDARKHGKSVPSLSVLLPLVRADCPVCGVVFSALAGGRSSAASPSLQHWPDGTFGIICLGCNAAHGNMKRPELLGRLAPDESYCFDCDRVLKRSAFAVARARRSGLEHVCRDCRAARWKLRGPRLVARLAKAAGIV